MTVTPATYNSNTNLSLGNVPQVDDPVVYEALLNIHNAIENLLKGEGDGDAATYIAKQRNVVEVQADYAVTTSDGTVIADSSIAEVEVLLHTAVGYKGYMNSIVCKNDTFGVFITTQPGETFEYETVRFELFEQEYLNVVSDGVGWIVAR